MRSLTTLSIAAMLAAGSLTGAMAQTFSTAPNIYVYNFNDAGASSGNSAANTAALFAVDKTPTGTTTGSALSSNFGAAFITNNAGSTVNADGGDAALQGLTLQGGTGAVAGGTGGNNGGYLQATADLSAYTGISVSFATQKTSTGFNSNQFAYSTDGGLTFTNFGAAYTPAAAYALQTFDLSGITALNNNANDVFQITFNGVSSSSGNNRIDNLTIAGTPAAVPEASTTVSFGLLLALGLGGFAASRRRKVTAN